MSAVWQRSNYIPGVWLWILACGGSNDVTTGASEAYPDLKSIHAATPPSVAFARAESVASTMEGWQNCQVIDTWKLKCEAVEEGLFGGTDDVWITVTKAGPVASTVSMRSASRDGWGSSTNNARRIRDFQQAYEAFTPGALPD